MSKVLVMRVHAFVKRGFVYLVIQNNVKYTIRETGGDLEQQQKKVVSKKFTREKYKSAIGRQKGKFLLVGSVLGCRVCWAAIRNSSSTTNSVFVITS